MLRAFRRFPALAAILALSLIAGPAASALCAHAELASHGEMSMEGHEMPMEASGKPCHDAPAPEESVPVHDKHDGVDCDAPCCVAADAQAPVIVAPATPAGLVASADVVMTGSVGTAHALPVRLWRPPPSRLYLETGRVRR